MRPDDQDAALLWDMLQAAKQAVEYANGKSLEQYFSDDMLQAAVERRVEIIGEAARKVSRRFKDANEHIPWQKIVSQRNVLAHEYGEVRQDLMWSIATIHAPVLIRELEPLLPPPPVG